VNRLVNRWAAMFGWATLMLIVWALFVPSGLSVGNFMLLCAAGPILLAAGVMLWNAQRPSPSIRQLRATLEADDRTRSDARTSG